MAMVVPPRMKKARDIMIPLRKVVTLSPSDSLEKAVRKLAGTGVSGAPVVIGREKRVVGVLSESDILRYVEKTEAEMRGGEKAMITLERAIPTRVRNLMSKNLVTVGQEAGLDEVVKLMVRREVNRVVVVDEKRSLRGLVARADVLRAA
jgi:CBS domain-containing protein